MFSTARFLTENDPPFGTSKGFRSERAASAFAGRRPTAIGPRSLYSRVFVLPSKLKPLPAHFAVSYESCAPHSHWYGRVVL